MNGTGRRVRRETGWRSLACAVCGPDTTHALITSGVAKFRWFGPPATQLRDYARCLRCGSVRSQEDGGDARAWTEPMRRADEPADEKADAGGSTTGRAGAA
jgi:hypothetical protein